MGLLRKSNKLPQKDYFGVYSEEKMKVITLIEVNERLRNKLTKLEEDYAWAEVAMDSARARLKQALESLDKQTEGVDSSEKGGSAEREYSFGD